MKAVLLELERPLDPSNRPRRLRWSDILLIAVGASYWPLAVLARHLSRIPHPERLLLISLVVFGIGIGALWLLMRMRLESTSVSYSVFISMVLVMSGGRVIRAFGDPVGWAVILGIIGLAFIVFARIGGVLLGKALVAGLAVALISGVPISGWHAWQEWEDQQVRDLDPPEVSFIHRPDVFLVVLDGYPGLLASRMDSADSRDAWSAELTEGGFSVPGSAWASYWETTKSLPSLFEMDYPMVEREGGEATVDRLDEIVGGDSAFRSAMSANGYETLMIESGWVGSDCGRGYDTCVSSRFLDEGMFVVLEDTVLGPYVEGRFGHAFTVGTQHTMEWLVDQAARISASPEPQFVFGHLLAPHAPFHLDDSCARVVRSDRSGLQFNRRGTSPAAREAFFLEQRACVDRFIRRLSSLVQPDDVLVFVGDHGTDRRDQLNLISALWDEDMIVERMNVFIAARMGRPGCNLSDQVVVPNLLREVLGCMSETEVEEVAPRMFIRGMDEVDSDYVSRLLTRG